MTLLDEKVNPFLIGRTHRDITKHLKKNGWSLTRERGDHEIYTHPKSINNVTVPKHKGDLAPGTIRDIMSKSQLEESKDDPSSRLIGTDSLTNILKSETPGQSVSKIKIIKRVLKEIKDASSDV